MSGAVTETKSTVEADGSLKLDNLSIIINGNEEKGLFGTFVDKADMEISKVSFRWILCIRYL